MRRHWPKFVAFALFVWTVGVRVLGWAGSIDLVVSRTQDPAWMGAVIGYLLSPPIWLDVGLIGTGLALIWWDNKRRIATASPEKASKSLSTKEQASPRPPKPPVKVAAIQQGSPTADDELPNWQILFAEQDDGTICLKIYPDTPHVMRDSFCLALFAYGFLKGMDEVPKSLVEPEMRRLMSSAPTSPMQKALSVDHAMHAWFVNDFGQSAVDVGRVERFGLSTGIRYRLLWHARDEYLSQARDLIRRA